MSEGTKPRGGGGRGGKRGRGRSGGDGKGSGASRGGRGGRGGKNSDGRPNGRGKGEKQALSLDEQLALHPYSHALHQAHIASLKESDASEADQDQAYEMYNAYLPLSPQLWAEWIERKKNALDINNEEHLEGIVEVLELYKRGCAESLSIPLHLAYAEYIVSLYYISRGIPWPLPSSSDGEADESMQLDASTSTLPSNAVSSAIFDVDFVRDQLNNAVSTLVRWHITEGQKVWDVLFAFESDILIREPEGTTLPSAESLAHLRQVYLDRLAEPSTLLSSTFQSFSTFTTTYSPESYEAELVGAQSIYSASTNLVSERDQQEDNLKTSGESIEAYKAYLAWEKEVKRPDWALTRTLYERALAKHGEEPSLWQDYIEFTNKNVKAPAARDGLSPPNSEDLVALCNRAVRSVPSSGEVAALCIRTLESSVDIEQAALFSEAQYSRATESDCFDISLEDFLKVLIARADLTRHASLASESAGDKAEGEDSEGEQEDDEDREDGTKTADQSEAQPPSEDLVNVLSAGIEKVGQITEGKGDPYLRLEKYLIRQYERAGMHDEAAEFLKKLTKTYKESAMVMCLKAETQVRQNNISGTRRTFVQGCKKPLDYPDYLYDAYITFEHQNGTLASLEKAMRTVEKEMKFVNAKRMKQMERAQREAAAAAAYTASAQQEQAPDASQLQEAVSAAEVPTMQATNPSVAESIPHEANAEASTSSAAISSLKRPAEEDLAVPAEGDQSNKKLKQEQSPAPAGEVKRDRENSTVFVAGLPKDTEEAAVRKLFRDCGAIREVKLRSVGEQSMATVEFMQRESVLAALTKDKKQVEGQEIAVHLDWQSTLYITNFPESWDDAALRKAFEPFGTIFDTRWPSKRLKSTRRFAYLQFLSPASANASLALHNTQVVPGSGQKIQVKLSDPTRRQNRTDANADKKELYVSGVARHVKEEDLERLFAQYGKVKAVRVMKDDQGLCRGFAFVDFEDEEHANAALALNNYELKKRRIAVTLADSRVTVKAKQPDSGQGRRADLKARSIRVTGLPPGSQEPIVQQAFEKYGAIEATTILDGGEATVTFTDAADVGKLLLAMTSIPFGDSTISFGPEGVDPAASKRATAPGASASNSFVPRHTGASARGMSRAGRARGSRLGIGASRPQPKPASPQGEAKAGENGMQVDGGAQNGSEATKEPAPGAKTQDDFRKFLSAGSAK